MLVRGNCTKFVYSGGREYCLYIVQGPELNLYIQGEVNYACIWTCTKSVHSGRRESVCTGTCTKFVYLGRKE